MWAERISIDEALAHLQSLGAAPGFAWLDSNREGARDGRYSFASAWPVEEIRVPFGAKSPFSVLQRVHTAPEQWRAGPSPSHVPGWIGYIAYDAYWSAPVQGRPRLPRGNEPILGFWRYPALLAIDHAARETWLVGDDRSACNGFRERLQSMSSVAKPGARVGPIQVDDPALHERSIERALAYIEQGQVYEVNLARRWSASFRGDPLALWQRMRSASRVPLGMFLDTEDCIILACTMERFIRWDAETKLLVTRPIKGTIRRDGGDDGASDRLRADPKERAEHSMVVDLMRNDLGRVAEVGSVRVEQPLVVEPFSGLYHLVSTVSCSTRDGLGLESILEATFPPGSVTGAPKIRAIEIIEELERHPRGIYCGALGFIDRAGGISLAVAIRTAVVRDTRISYWAGGGIVEASDPGREVAETQLKAKVFLDAVRALDSDSHAPARSD